jgi:hemoglobin
MSRFTPFALLLAGALAVGTGCQDKDKEMDKDSGSMSASMDKSGKSLYDRLGGEKAISKVVDDFVALGAPDPKVNFTRKGHPNHWEATPENVAKLKKRLVEFIAMAAGGPNNYKGRDMVTAHRGMEITEAEFNALAADLSAALDKNKVPAREKAELMAAVAGTKGQIVGK